MQLLGKVKWIIVQTCQGPEMKMRVTVRHSAKGAICTACSGSGKGLNFFRLRWTSSDKNAFSFRGQ